MTKHKKILFSFLVLTFFSIQAAKSIHTIKSLNYVIFAKYAGEQTLNISHYEITSIKWSRNPITDLPRCYSHLAFKIYGRSDFSNAHFTVTLDGSSACADITSLKAGFNLVQGFIVISDYQDFGVSNLMKCYLTAKSSYGFVYAYSEFSYKVDLPRYLDERVASLYITPNNPEIKNLVENITGSSSYLPRWLALLNWVSSNINYKYDIESHGRSEFWQLPIETIHLGTGDCEDYAILLCSLYRAAGYDENSVYVILGYTRNVGHAWVRIYAQVGGIGTWVNIEPQVGGILSVFYGLIDITMYDDVFQFNDVYFTRLK